MSVPTRQLQKLQIGGGMTPLTRSEAQRQRRQRERQQRQQAAAQDAPEPSTGPPPATAIRGHTGLLYDIRQLSSNAQVSAAHGLQSEYFMVDISRKHEFIDTTHYFAFQLREAESVRVFDPTGGSERRVSCTCEEFGRNRGTAVCAHIYWLYDGINDALGDIPSNVVLPVDRPSVERCFTSLYNSIGKNINHLQDELNQTWDEASDDTDEMIQDMLAVFTTDRTWDEFDDEFLSSVPEAEGLPFEQLVAPGNLATTIFALARHDPVFRDRLRNAVTKEICARDFLSKLETKQQNVFKRFDDYMNRGPRRPRLEVGFVSACASRLCEILSKVSVYKEGMRAPLSHNFDVASAKLALRMLNNVCGRNRNIYSDSAEQTSEESPPKERDCNLFTNVISDPPPERRDEMFTIDLLTDNIPLPALTSLAGELERLMEKLRQQKAPAPYLNKMQELIDNARAGGQLADEAEGRQTPTSSGIQWRHVVGLASPGAEPSARVGRERRPTLDPEGPESQRRRLA